MRGSGGGDVAPEVGRLLYDAGMAITRSVTAAVALALACVLTTSVTAQTRPGAGAATRPAGGPTGGPSTRASAVPSPELLAMWKELEASRAEAVVLARAVEKGESMERARANQRELGKQTAKFNAMIAPVAAASPLRYGPAVQQPKQGFGRAVWLYKRARAVEAYNLARRSEMTADEFGVFTEVNTYREALGLAPLEYHVGLRDAARGHSAWMKETGTFDHDSEKPGHKTFSQRIKAEGYDWNAAAENIAMGQTTAREVFDGWFDSPGHHHNLVGDFVHLGVGKAGEYWTQNFAKGEAAKATTVGAGGTPARSGAK